MKDSTSYTKKLLRISCLYSLAFLVLTIISVMIIKNNAHLSQNTEIKETVKTEYVYVEKQPDNTFADVYVEPDEQVYTVREHMGKIGIFLPNGSLVQTIEVYVKTLPTADRRLLEEGFEVVGKQRLYSIIEDYSE